MIWLLLILSVFVAYSIFFSFKKICRKKESFWDAACDNFESSIYRLKRGAQEIHESSTEESKQLAEIESQINALSAKKQKAYRNYRKYHDKINNLDCMGVMHYICIPIAVIVVIAVIALLCTIAFHFDHEETYFEKVERVEQNIDLPTTYDGLKSYCADWDSYMDRYSRYRKTVEYEWFLGWPARKILTEDAAHRAAEAYAAVQSLYKEAELQHFEGIKKLEIINGERK